MSEGVCPIDVDTSSEPVQRHASPSTPVPLRMMAARGLAPMPARDLITAQFVLTYDADRKVAETARNSLIQLDPRLANTVLGDAALSPFVLGHLAHIHATNDAFIETLLLNPSTPTEIFPLVAGVCSEPIAELIANNQARLLEAPEIVRGLVKNPHVLKSTSDRIVDFLVRNGVILEGLREFEDALFRLGADERLEAARSFDIPPELMDERLLSEDERKALEANRKLIEDDDSQRREEDELEKLPLEERLRRKKLPELVAWATTGNRQIRKLLMRHTNRIVALSAVTSPMIQEPEIIEAVNSKVTHQDVVGHIAKDKKNNWVRNYQVKLGLVSNPKTPLPEAMKLVPTLNARDVKQLARSKNVPMGVRNLATGISRRQRN